MREPTWNDKPLTICTPRELVAFQNGHDRQVTILTTDLGYDTEVALADAIADQLLRESNA